MKRTVQSALRQSAKGVRIEVSGRLNGAEIARTEWYREGSCLLYTSPSPRDATLSRMPSSA